MRTVVRLMTVSVLALVPGICSVSAREGTAGARTHQPRAAAETRTAEHRKNAEKTTEAKEAAKEKREKVQEAAQDRVDKRQDKQAHRIEHGIKKGYLTADEIGKLDAQQKSIAAMEDSFKSDGKITRVEGKQLREELNQASLCIFAEKHDADGNTMPVYRLGKNVTLNDSVAQKLGDETLTKQEARAFLKDFRRTVELKRKLATEDLSDEARSKLQAEYDGLLNQYFTLK